MLASLYNWVADRWGGTSNDWFELGFAAGALIALIRAPLWTAGWLGLLWAVGRMTCQGEES